jgi:hypothetical protein
MLVESVVAGSAGKCSRNTADHRDGASHRLVLHDPGVASTIEHDHGNWHEYGSTVTMNPAQIAGNSRKTHKTKFESMASRWQALSAPASLSQRRLSCAGRHRVQQGRAPHLAGAALTTSSGAAAEGAGSNTTVPVARVVSVCAFVDCIPTVHRGCLRVLRAAALSATARL